MIWPRYLFSILLLLVLYTCSALANVDPKAKQEVSKNGQKRLDIHASKWREAQNAINSLIDESISNEVAKAKMEVKALLEKNIAKHLHEASRQVMHSRLSQNDELEPTTEFVEGSRACQDEIENCAALAASGVCDTSRAAMKKHCARTCELCDDEGADLPPASPAHGQSANSDTWTIIGANGERFTTSIKDIESGTRKASITSAQVERLLDYVKHNAPHLKLEKVKPGVLKLIKIPDKKRPTPHKITLKPQKDKPKKVEKQKDAPEKTKPKEEIHPDNYWRMKEDKNEKIDFMPKHPKAKGPMIHFDLSTIAKDKPGSMAKAVHVYKDGPSDSFAVHHATKSKSEEYLKHICHPMCKKTCISSCAPGCCAGEHHKSFPLYHRKSSHCHPYCKKHCISSCPLTCCAETETVSKTWKHPHVHHIKPGCHPLCKKNCVPSCPKACCAPKTQVRKSHCHPLCKTNCLSSCPLSCCSRKDRLKEKCHPLCRKTCLPACPGECCAKDAKGHRMIMKSSDQKTKAVAKVATRKTCPGLCPDSCAPACHDGCCSSKKMTLSRSKPLVHSVPSGCTANCVYECIPGCPPACCTKSLGAPEVSRYTYKQPEPETPDPAPVMISFPQPFISPYIEQPQMNPQEQAQAMYSAEEQLTAKNTNSASADSQSVNANAVNQNQGDSTALFAPKHCPSSCLTHCSPECVRSDCCDLD
ncbi:uncharacterized protein LOC114524282 [Dendronephthya gigantea]|uniref:uncharacterized protein LOC114524282 n=1 Tax=Dendronephthya gigantea TaxID=151771 RepID=UPI00106CA862|nr:uncharacterized protein LOC114524282 [Dendronephthya gigantea]XP_028401238.1 uncharacterized protein LOC114524282 [Dendronephthya gigantea]